MKNLGNFNPEKKKDVQLDLPFEDTSKNKITQHGEGEFQQDYLDDHKKNQEKIIHLSYVEEETDPVAREALKRKIEEKEKEEREQQEINEMEKAAYARQEAEEIAERRKELDDLYRKDGTEKYTDI